MASSDIVERLQEMFCWMQVDEVSDAITEITRLHEQVERLRALLTDASTAIAVGDDENERLRALLAECVGHVATDTGWDYDSGGYLLDRIEAAIEKRPEEK